MSFTNKLLLKHLLRNLLSENRYKDQIDQEIQDGTNAGIQGTPGFVIGVLDKDGNVDGKMIAGAYPYESFKAIIDEMLAK